MYNDHGLGIDNLDIGVSTRGASEYFQSLQAQLLTGVETIVNDTEAVIAALDKGWQGVSRDKFDQQFQAAREQLLMDLRKEYTDLVTKIGEVVESYINQDKNMIID